MVSLTPIEARESTSKIQIFILSKNTKIAKTMSIFQATQRAFKCLEFVFFQFLYPYYSHSSFVYHCTYLENTKPL